MRRLMKPDQRAMHKMAGEQHERHGKPDPPVENSKANGSLGEYKGGYDQRESRPTHPMSVPALVGLISIEDRIHAYFGRSERSGVIQPMIHNNHPVRATARFFGPRHTFVKTARNKLFNSVMSAAANISRRNSQTTSKPAPNSVISQPRSNRAVPVERIRNLVDSRGSATSGTRWFCKAKRTSNTECSPGVRASPRTLASSANGMAEANEFTAVSWTPRS